MTKLELISANEGDSAFSLFALVFVFICWLVECDDTGIQLTFNPTSGDLLPSFPVKWSQISSSTGRVMNIQPGDYGNGGNLLGSS